MNSLGNQLALAEGIAGDIFIKAIQFGGGEKARALSERFQNALRTYPPGSINAGNREAAAQEFGAIGELVPSLFGDEGEERREGRRARRAAANGRDMTSSLSVDARALEEECSDVDGLTDGEKVTLAGLAGRGVYDDTTYGSFFRGVLLGSP
jgi:hypothetical protein